MICLFLNISSYPREFLAFKDLIIVSTASVVVCFNLMFANGCLNALCK